MQRLDFCAVWACLVIYIYIYIPFSRHHSATLDARKQYVKSTFSAVTDEDAEMPAAGSHFAYS